MANLTNTQLMVLTQAAQREDGAAIVPERMGPAAIRKNSEALVVRKLMREVLTKTGMPIWRKAEDGRSISLVILKAGRDLVSAKSEAFHTDPGFLVTNQSVAAPNGDSAATKAVAQPRLSHASFSPSLLMLFFSRRFSRVRSATTSFRADASCRSSLTSADLGARAVSPANRPFPASRNSLDQP